MRGSARFAPLVALSSLLVLSPSGSTATEDPRHTSERVMEEAENATPSSKRFSLRLSLETFFDDNILNLRDDAIDEFESGQFEPDRFLIRSVDDEIFTPEIEAKFSRRPSSGRATRLGVVGSATRPGANEVSDFKRYGIYLQQDLSDLRADLNDARLDRRSLRPRAFKARRKFMVANRSGLRVGYFHTESRYAGQLSDDDYGLRRAARYVDRDTNRPVVDRLERNTFDEAVLGLTLNYYLGWRSS